MVRRLSRRVISRRVIFAIACLTSGFLAPQGAMAQNPISPPPLDWKPTGDPSLRYLQRSLEIYEFKRAAASGVERGREIFYFKCWMCHNEFAKLGGPRLEGLYQRPALLTGKPVTDDTVKEQIRNGSPNMAGYRFTLEEADLDDLVKFVREKCCWNDSEPPLNPRYIAR